MSVDVESAKSFIEKQIESHYQKNSRPLYIQELGQAFSKEFGVDPKTVLRQGLKTFIEEYLREKYTVVLHSKIKQKIAVAPIDRKSEVKRRIENDGEHKSNDGEGIHLKRLHKRVVYAFQLKPDQDQRVYIQVAPTIQHYVASSPPDTGNFVEVDRDLLTFSGRPRFPNQLSEEERQALRANIKKWCDRKGLSLDDITFVRREKDSASSQKTLSNDINALNRLINAQDASVKSQILIPGDIAEILQKYK